MELTIQLDTETRRMELFGPSDKHLRMLRDAFEVHIAAREDAIMLSGDKEQVEKAADVIDHMQKRLIKRGKLTDVDVDGMVMQAKANIDPEGGGAIIVFSNKGVIEPFTEGQLAYINTMLGNDLTFCTGPAGTGKTYLAVAVAVSMLKKKQIRKIVLARPAVEAGEKLGFLPGDIAAKVNPYLRPLFDSLEDMMEFSQMKKFMEMDIIEIIPLAFMRGRTLNEACIICDEAQNTSSSQMLMFLTRMGRGSKMIITGDITQVDLARGEMSGLVDAVATLDGIPGIGMVELSQADIVRHKLVHTIVQAYDHKNKRLAREGRG
ncbi:MAG: PhoH family protein [Sedimentisphaerales bacterium]|nr:PhoH family protein [Sedimentisphaerales bacterium]